MSPCSSKDVGASIRKANKAGIPVFTVDLACTDETAEIVSHVETDNYGGGKLAGDAMIKALGKDGGKVLILHFKTADSCVQRVTGFTEVIDAHNKALEDGASKIEIVQTLPSEGKQLPSKKSTEDFVQGNKDLRAIFAINDPAALGAYTALKQVGMEKQVTIVGFDGEQAGKQAIKDGKIVAVGGPDLAVRGRREVAATEKVVAPGWCDIHTHYDGQISWDSLLAPSSAAGVTTLRVRQSSSQGTGTWLVRPSPGSCGAAFPKRRASRTPSHGSWGMGAAKRRSPTGGSA